MGYVNGMLLGVLLLIAPAMTWAGSLDDTGDPETDGGGAMFTLEDVYNRLNSGAAGAKRGGPFTEPLSGPASSGHTLDEVMGKAPVVDDAKGAGMEDVANGKTFWGLKSGEWGLKMGTGTIATDPAPVPRTGQTQTVPLNSPPAGSDGYLEKGVAWPNPRFTDNGNGTVTDNLTGLIWLKRANYNSTTGTTGIATWADALTFCNTLNDGECGLSDGSVEGAWRLPNRFELESLLDLAYDDPALSNDAGTDKWGSGTSSFTGVQSAVYWSSSSVASGTGDAWLVGLNTGGVAQGSKADKVYVWPVRGGTGPV